jgi:hypothetical protein
MDKELKKITEESIKKRNALLKERKKTALIGDDVIHLTHNGCFSSADYDEFSNDLAQINLRLSHFNNSGFAQNSLDDFMLTVSLSISSPIFQLISNNVIWETVKYLALKLLKKTREKKYYKITQHGAEEKHIKCGIKIKVNEATSIDFELNGNLSDETVLKSIDKITDITKILELNQTPRPPFYTKYDDINERWMIIDEKTGLEIKTIYNTK